MNIKDLPNSKLAELIDEWSHSERDRVVAKRHFIDGITIEKVAEEIDMSPRHTARIVKRIKEILQTNA